MFGVDDALMLLPTAVQTIGGLFQKGQANNLKKSNYVPPQLLMNRDLAMQQAYSRRAPGAAFAESQNRRLASNQIAAGQRMFGGDANKMAAISAGAVAGAEDANSRIAAQGQAFSEGAFGRLQNANNALAQNDRLNQEQYLQTKNALDNAGNVNLFNGINNAATYGYLKRMGFKDNALSTEPPIPTDQSTFPTISTPFSTGRYGAGFGGRFNGGKIRIRRAS